MLPEYYALQDARDYWHVLTEGIPQVLKISTVNADDVIGLGIDFTASTVMFVDEDFEPLHTNPAFEHNPDAYVKLWKDHSSEREAQHIRDVAQQDAKRWLGSYGYNVSSEWAIPKIMKVYNEAPEVIVASKAIMQAGDWIVNRLTGQHVLSNCGIGFKSFWDDEEGFYYDLFADIHPDLPGIVRDKVAAPVVHIGDVAGYLTEEVAEALGLTTKVAVSPFIIDAHASVLGLGSKDDGDMTMVMGTSTCPLMLHAQPNDVAGISGYVKGGIVPHLYAYEAGQPAVGDLFDYVIRQTPQSILDEAKTRGVHVYDVLNERAERLPPGGHGLIALDWHNGSRHVTGARTLSGVLVGLTLETTHEEMYRAYIEATAYCTRQIIEAFERKSMSVRQLCAAGGIPKKNRLIMQIYADVLNRPIAIGDSDNEPAIGAAILGAYVGGAYSTIEDAMHAMKANVLYHVTPNAHAFERYQTLYAQYNLLQNYFTREEPELMYRLAHDASEHKK